MNRRSFQSLLPIVSIACLLASRLLADEIAGRPADRERRPNILLAIADDWSWPHASAYGCRFVDTPAFDRVAREGVLFTRGYCASPGCSPSRAALLTGKNTWQLEQAGTHDSSFPAELQVYPDRLESAGYWVGYTGKGWGPGNWKVSGRTRNPAGPVYNDHTDTPPNGGISNQDYAANFKEFLAKRPKDRPFCFWYGGHEPHRKYTKGSGVAAGKKTGNADVPPFLPDTPEIRGDLLDYAFEVEWFDRHLGEMLAMLDEMGELDNTIVVVTGDNGMPFPRAKANDYEYGTHVPLAIRWPARVKGGRVVDDLVGFVDLAPTFLDAAGAAGVSGMAGKSLLGLLTSGRQGRVDPSRDRVFMARERHSSSRMNNLGYPMRAIRTGDYLYVRNFTPDRWPAGDPRGVGDDPFGYYDIDDSPSKSFVIEHRDSAEFARFFHLAVDKRPDEELYEVKSDPATIDNLANRPEYAGVAARLRTELEDYLRLTKDPRMLGTGDVYESYPKYSRMRDFK